MSAVKVNELCADEVTVCCDYRFAKHGEHVLVIEDSAVSTDKAWRLVGCLDDLRGVVDTMSRLLDDLAED